MLIVYKTFIKKKKLVDNKEKNNEEEEEKMKRTDVCLLICNVYLCRCIGKVPRYSKRDREKNKPNRRKKTDRNKKKINLCADRLVCDLLTAN